MNIGEIEEVFYFCATRQLSASIRIKATFPKFITPKETTGVRLQSTVTDV
jgi:hypothetical protein